MTKMIEENLMGSAQYFCERYNINKSTIKMDLLGHYKFISFGDIQNDGFEIGIHFYNDGEINRIIISAGQNNQGKSIYIETRNQEILDQFLYNDIQFSNWVDQGIEYIESMF